MIGCVFFFFCFVLFCLFVCFCFYLFFCFLQYTGIIEMVNIVKSTLSIPVQIFSKTPPPGVSYVNGAMIIRYHSQK